MGKDVFADTRMHPNLALTEGLTQRPVCCLVLEQAQDAQLNALGVRLVHVYRQGSLCAVLFELPKESAWQAALEARLAASATGRAGLSRRLSNLRAREEALRTFAGKLRRLADRRISIDLDDGVEHN